MINWLLITHNLEVLLVELELVFFHRSYQSLELVFFHRSYQSLELVFFHRSYSRWSWCSFIEVTSRWSWCWSFTWSTCVFDIISFKISSIPSVLYRLPSFLLLRLDKTIQVFQNHRD